MVTRHTVNILTVSGQAGYLLNHPRIILSKTESLHYMYKLFSRGMHTENSGRGSCFRHQRILLMALLMKLPQEAIEPVVP